MSAAWFVDGAYALKAWQSVSSDKLDFLRLRNILESKYLDGTVSERIEDAYYFNADSDPPTAKQNAFHNALAFPPPTGPGLRVKLYWLQKKPLFWPAHMGGDPVVHPKTGQCFELTQQKAVDVGLAFHLMRSFSKRKWTKLFLVAGDGDFHEAVQHLVEHEDVDLILVGTMRTISEDLRPYARSIFEFDHHLDELSRPVHGGVLA
jgi:uncharacterized LabA/DUF88 family protein